MQVHFWQYKVIHVKVMQNRLLKWIIGHYSKDAIKGSLHLRRGDSINDCDRSVDEIRDYLACSLDGTESLGRNLTMTFMTYESDTKYRTKHHGFIGWVSPWFNSRWWCIIVGEAVRNGLIEKDVENNFYTDDVESVIPSLLITVVLKNVAMGQDAAMSTGWTDVQSCG